MSYRAVRGFGILSVIAVVAMFASAAVAQPAPVPVRVAQASDGTLYVTQGSNAWTLVPDQATDSEVGALNPGGEIDAVFPNEFFAVQSAVAAPVPVRVVQGPDGALFALQGNNSWTLIPDQISDSDVAALNPSGEIDGTFPNDLFVVSATTSAAPPTPTPPPSGAAESIPTPSAGSIGSGFVGHELQLEVDSPLGGRAGGPYNVTPAQEARFTNLPAGALPGWFVYPVSIKVTNSTLEFDFSQMGQNSPFAASVFNGYVFTASPGTSPISSVTIDPSSTLRLDNLRVFATSNQIQVNVQGLAFDTHTTARLNVKFGEPPSGAGLAGHQLQMSVYGPTVSQMYYGPFNVGAIPGQFATLQGPGLIPVDIAVTDNSLEISFAKTSGGFVRRRRIQRIRVHHVGRHASN